MGIIDYSFIIPHKNSLQLLGRCLASIPERDDIEIIVVDDNSTLEERPVPTRPDMQVIYVDERETKGAGHARNVGMDASQGKWLLFADCDDYYHEGFIDQLDVYKNNQETDIVVFDATTFMDSSNWANIIKQYGEGKCSKRKLLMCSNMPWNKMFNSKFVKRIGARFEEIPIGNDAWFVVYCGSKADGVAVIPEKLYCYVDNPSGITRAKRPLKDYFVPLRSSIKQNKLKAKCGLLDLVFVPGYQERKIRRLFGTPAFLLAFLYRMTHDWTLVPAVCMKSYIKVRKRISRRN